MWMVMRFFLDPALGGPTRLKVKSSNGLGVSASPGAAQIRAATAVIMIRRMFAICSASVLLPGYIAEKPFPGQFQAS